MAGVTIMVLEKPFLFPLGELEEQDFLEELIHFVVKGRSDWAPVPVFTLIKVPVIIIVFRGLQRQLSAPQEDFCRDKPFGIYK